VVFEPSHKATFNRKAFDILMANTTGDYLISTSAKRYIDELEVLVDDK